MLKEKLIDLLLKYKAIGKEDIAESTNKAADEIIALFVDAIRNLRFW